MLALVLFCGAKVVHYSDLSITHFTANDTQLEENADILSICKKVVSLQAEVAKVSKYE